MTTLFHATSVRGASCASSPPIALKGKEGLALVKEHIRKFTGEAMHK